MADAEVAPALVGRAGESAGAEVLGILGALCCVPCAVVSWHPADRVVYRVDAAGAGHPLWGRKCDGGMRAEAAAVHGEVVLAFDGIGHWRLVRSPGPRWGFFGDPGPLLRFLPGGSALSAAAGEGRRGVKRRRLARERAAGGEASM